MARVIVRSIPWNRGAGKGCNFISGGQVKGRKTTEDYPLVSRRMTARARSSDYGNESYPARSTSGPPVGQSIENGS
jgi:hypothetical protein